MVHTYNEILFDLKRKDSVTHDTKWMNSEDTIVKERQILYDPTFMELPKGVKFRDKL